jgi:hypothetical protein
MTPPIRSRVYGVLLRGAVTSAIVLATNWPALSLAQLALPSIGETNSSTDSAPSQNAHGYAESALDTLRAGASHLVQDSALQTKLQELAGNLAGSGPHAVSSPNGEKVISMIRMLPKADADARDAILHRIQALAMGGVPEAVTFLGFAAEVGLFGIARQPEKSALLYRAAAQSGYQPALYNLAVMSAYGRGQARDLRKAERLLGRAVTAGPEGSNRVCGMASFVAYRLNDRVAMRTFAEGCNGPLSALAIAAVDPASAQTNLVSRLKTSIGSGVDDGYLALEAVTRHDAPNDTQFSYCMWLLVDRYRAHPSSPEIAPSAGRCIESVSTAGSKVATLEPQARQQAAVGLAHTVSAEIQELAIARRANRFHFGMPVPYLPFTQEDVDLFSLPTTLGEQR